ncbi:MAG: PAS domain-containing protein, partial [Bacteroidetes bacterium]|nr:PAS domain-containing protein [Bacteroidota bacterium]
MPNNVNSNNIFERKNYLSLSEFESFYELPESNPLMIVDAACKIIFSNSTFKNTFNLPEVQTFFDLNSEPNLSYLLVVLTGSSFNNFHFDLFFSPEHNLKQYNYNVEAERIFIENNEYFVIIFKSLEEKAKIEERINSLHNALEYSNIPVLITDSEGKIVYTTNLFEKILKAEIETIYNCSIADALSFYLTKEEKHRLEESIETLKTWTKTIMFSDAEKKVIYYELKLNPIFRNGEENLRFILTANDITNYVLKHQIIKKSERRLKSIINNISDLLFICKERKGEFLFENANDNFCNIFSINKYKDLKKDINSVIEENLLKQLKTSLQKFNQQNNNYTEFTYASQWQREYKVKITSIDDKVENEKI